MELFSIKNHGKVKQYRRPSTVFNAHYCGRFLIPVFIIALSILSTGCDDTLTEQEIDNTVIPPSNVLFGKHILPVFNLKCNVTGCHNQEARAGGIVLTSRTYVTADLSVVFPGEPQTSRLVWAIQRQSGASPMPPVPYPGLTENQIEGIKTWIREGAKDN